MTFDAQLEGLTESLDQAQQRLHKLIDTLPESSWAAKPAPDKWSAAECVDHLNLTSRAFIPSLREAVSRAAPAGRAAGRYRMDPTGWLISLMTGPLPRVGRWRLGRVRTTPGFVPAAAPPMDSTMAAFDVLQEELKALVRQAAGKAIDKVNVPSPFDSSVSYSAYSALVIIPRHQVRHIRQAELGRRSSLHWPRGPTPAAN